MPVQGLWNIGGINIPDFGWSEKASAATGGNVSGGLFGGLIQNNAALGGTVLGSSNQPSNNYVSTNPMVNQAAGNAISNPITTPKPLGGGGTGGGTPQLVNNQPVNNQVSSGGEVDNSAVISGINNAFQPIFDQLDSMLNGLPGAQSNMTEQIGTMADTSKQGLEISQGAELGEMEGAKTDLRNRTASAKRETDTSMRNALLAGQIYLGSQGAGNSSAVGRYSGALAKAAGRNTALIQNKANELWNTIVQKESDIRTTFSLAVNNLDQWKNEKTSAITQWYYDRVGEIENQRLTATGEKAAALANLATTAYQAALQRLSNLQAESRSYSQAIESWIAQKSTSVQDFKNQLAQFGQAPDMTLPQTTIPGITKGPASQTTTGGGYMTPAQNRLKTEEESMTGLLNTGNTG